MRSFTRQDGWTLLVLAALAAGSVYLAGLGKASKQGSAPADKPGRAAASVVYGTLADTRDGKTYRTVEIGAQTWMADNLNCNFGNSRCYEDKESNCAVYGRLYDWEAAMDACHSGWHLPTVQEWNDLMRAVGSDTRGPPKHGNLYDTVWFDAGKKLKAASGWYKNYRNVNNGNGTDDYGFSALPGGSHDRRSYNAGSRGLWWTATEYNSDIAYSREMSNEGDSDVREGERGKTTELLSVRCVMDSSDIPTSVTVRPPVNIDMVFVRGETFMMGCTAEQGNGCVDWEKPAHSVTVGDFYIGRYEVTQSQWVGVMGGGNNPSHFKGDDLPVEQVDWDDVQKFILKLNEMTGKKYRLPTEAEWEYAARGGWNSNGASERKYSGSDDVNDVAWYAANSGDTGLRDDFYKKYIDKLDFDGYHNVLKSNNNRTHPVGTKSPNKLGIYDMSGNVYEWVGDWFGAYSSTAQTNPKGPASGDNRVIRGGSWNEVVKSVCCRVSTRSYNAPDYKSDKIGFRLARSHGKGTAP
jgi:uncharacterized protein (TIGR02145 family)